MVRWNIHADNHAPVCRTLASMDISCVYNLFFICHNLSRFFGMDEIVGTYLGSGFRNFLRIFSLLLLLFVGAAFVTGPAELLTGFSGGGMTFWLYGIFGYYIAATLFPINKIIGRIYPFLGLLCSLWRLVGGAMVFLVFSGKLELVELTFARFANYHHTPAQNLLFPMMFIVISCGPYQGFIQPRRP
jgi:carbon starvation protein CstA